MKPDNPVGRESAWSFAPARERGLKQDPQRRKRDDLMFAPARERGLKLSPPFPTNPGNPVRSRAGAWIETKSFRSFGCGSLVRSRAGAWIETSCWHRSPPLRRFAPARERGLKRHGAIHALRSIPVRSRAGAWIETITPAAVALAKLSSLPRGSVD